MGDSTERIGFAVGMTVAVFALALLPGRPAGAQSAPTVSVSDSTRMEGDGRASRLSFFISLSEPSVDFVRVKYATVAGSASEGIDFVARSGLLKLRPGQTSGHVEVSVVGDAVPEPAAEQLTLVVSDVIGAAIERGVGVGTIRDDDPKPTVGFMGGSISTNAVEGYHTVDGRRIWPVVGYGGGTVVVWSDPAAYPAGAMAWKKFDDMHGLYPATNAVWWELATHVEDTDDANYAAALLVLDDIQQRVPGARVYISAANGYIAPHVCENEGPGAAAMMGALVDRLVAEGRATRGPFMPELRAADSDGTGEVQVDDGGCHANAAGKLVLGPPLVDFFDRDVSAVLDTDTVAADGVSTTTLRLAATDLLGAGVPAEPITLATSGDATLGSVVDNGDGTYSAIITASTTPGDQTITATHGASSATAVLHELAVG